MSQVEHLAGQTYHGRKGGVANRFRYSVDYILLDAEAESVQAPTLFGRNSPALMAIHDTDHGGPPGQGRGSQWVRSVLNAHRIEQVEKIELLAQPRILGHVFNPVSFWLCYSQVGLIAVIAEVTNTFGERHSYLVRHPDLAPIRKQDRLRAEKIHYVSPFQPISGGYEFRFDVTLDRIGIWIDYTQSDGGIIATLSGKRAPLSNRGILGALFRRPFGSRRVLALIHWQALKLWLKGARYKMRPTPPDQEVS